MKKKITFFLLLTFIVVIAGNMVHAEDKKDLYQLSAYQSESKNPTVAVMGAWFFPSVGHAYAGDWIRGLPFLVINLAIPVSMAYGASGALLSYSFVGTKIWEFVDAYSTAEDSNQKLIAGMSNPNVRAPLTAKTSLAEDGFLEEGFVSGEVAAESKDVQDKITALEKKYDQQFDLLFKRLKLSKAEVAEKKD
ncbi:hypothetical protein A2276_07065 [candidate division WOR-1 bacterium RIFOXYA12_FULL_43_27]|uniref:TM2 domain-containing protein n=1 Tax=candidate division WOR-1 bacterium RIFOXYC2_FULL_46_14 TaxID=1802587 RepID=A0A1F4U3B1_UNCSA|nr:MAG: hypothetical protein A2276_07065 [candidate division WOR-1 bacterium RIFOXYA12_FULL_43_27]OGC18846.1 MAG: hypothetical protein A2292_07920 [candidate division WOR-1 bacterium RIFOXYB2_FULL_46_45]OGC28987.1 MAG: hypothetical protein A2232_02985 [candidate division WOR-1 bacterium RIFOXYA2_FULL_46_56]OGC39369.1 MAG: hypothetical protein A2438_06600 [candidate division WOR-1 bacterium RIFOXYC2_FULL_46_14]